VDINDVLLNAVGALIGYGLFKVFAWLYLAIIQPLNIKPRGLLAYIYSVADPLDGRVIR
jgi:glycopeptide antibiotics resistance protein